MCGIAGILGRDGNPVPAAALDRMEAAIVHRGPDRGGVHVEPGPPSVGLVSRRLAIIDVASGHQPMSTDDGSHTIVYNGEVFNAAEIRRELEALGHQFRTLCDTEVVLRGYVQWGSEVLGRLNGMWAFAIWDRRNRSLFLSRDRLGVKPLVYSVSGSTVLFGSEIKALLATGLLERSLDVTCLPHYLSSFAVPEPHSLVRGVRRLPAGCYLLIEPGKPLFERRYWDCALEEEPDRGLPAYTDKVEALIEDAVRRRLVSDVPLGVFLSGGIDSGLVAATAARALDQPLRTFTLGFESSTSDERAAARGLASALKTQHREGVVTAREAANALPGLLAAYDEPGQSLIQAHFISRLARPHVTVALAGIGGDELFSSYPTHRVVDTLARFDRLPATLRAIALVLSRSLGGRLRRAAHLAALGPGARVSGWLLHLTNAELRRALLSSDVLGGVDLDGPARLIQEHYERSPSPHPLNRLLYVYVKTYLPNELLRSLDMMSMQHSLEARVPLLDYRLVELAMRMPVRHKMSLREGKIVLRRVADRVLPAGTLAGKKRGFSLPLAAWMRGELAEAIRDVLSEPAVRRRGIFDARVVGQLVHQCLDGDPRSLQTVMMLFAFEQWARHGLDAGHPVAGGALPELAGPTPDLSVIVVNWNTRDILRRCLDSVRAHLSGIPHEVIVVDNASSDGSADMVAEEFPEVRLIRNVENVGFARANNQAMAVAAGEWFLLLNSDTLMIDDSVLRLFRRVSHEAGIGVAHCRLQFPDGTLQYSTYRFPSIRLAILEDLGFYKLLSPARRAATLLAGYWAHDQERDVDWVSGAFMLLPREVFERTLGFSERYFMYGEDMEWGYRIRDAGWRIRFYPQASIVHLDHSSSVLRWGDRRVQICIERQLDIYARRHGRVHGIAYNAIRIAGLVLRSAYFGVRSRLGGSTYHRDMYRFCRTALRTHAAILLGHR